MCISKIHSHVIECCSEYCEYISKHTNQQDDIRNWVSCDIDFTFAYCIPRANITKAKVWGFCSHWKICGFLVTIFPDKSALIKKIQMQIWMQIQIRIWWWDKQPCQVSSHQGDFILGCMSVRCNSNTKEICGNFCEIY